MEPFVQGYYCHLLYEGDYKIGIFLTFDDGSLFTYFKCSLLMFILIHSVHIGQSHFHYMLWHCVQKYGGQV